MNITDYLKIAWFLPLFYSIVACSDDKGMAPVAEVPYTPIAPKIDGLVDIDIWNGAGWKEINKLVIGEDLSAADFSGRYKMLWTEKHLYLLAEIVDDQLSDKHANPFERYWDDDTLEIFLDEDASGGLHQFSYNAFAYHIALDNQAVDIGPYLSDEDKKNGLLNLRTYPDHINSLWRRSIDSPHKIIWEVEISVFGDDYKDVYSPDETVVRPKKLFSGKKIGFMVAYCDSDSSMTREHFIGDTVIEPLRGDKNRGYIDASVFGKVVLIK